MSLGVMFPVIVRPDLMDTLPLLEPITSSKEGELNEQDKKTFTEAVIYFVSTAAKQSNSLTVYNLGVITKIVSQVNKNQADGSQLDVETLVKATMKIFLKNGIEAAFGPEWYMVFKASEFVDILRPALQDALLAQVTPGQPRILGRGYIPRDGIKELVKNVCLFAYGMLDVGSWPSRLSSWYSERLTTTMYDGLRDYGNAYQEGMRDLLKDVQISNIFPASVVGEMFHSMNSAELLAFGQAPAVVVPEVPSYFPLRSATGQEDGGEYELLDQLHLDDDVESVQKRPDAASSPMSISMGSSSSREIRFQLPNPFKPHPITEVVGGSFYVSGGSHTPTTFSAQVNVTIAGPKNLPAQRPAGLPQADSSTGGPVPNVLQLPDTVKKAQSYFNDCMLDRQNKMNIVDEIKKGFSENDSIADTIRKNEALITATKEAQAANNKALWAAWYLQDATDPHVQRKFVRNRVTRDTIQALNKVSLDVLRNVFGVPWNKKMEKKHVCQASSLGVFGSDVTKANTNLANANHNKEIIDADRVFTSQITSLRKMEAQDAPVDARRFSSSCTSMQSLGTKLINLVLSSSKLSAQEKAETEASIRQQMAQIMNREYRYAKVGEIYRELLNNEELTLAAIDREESPEKRKALLGLAAQKQATFESITGELITQSPNAEKNATLSQMRQDLATRVSTMNLVNENKGLRDTQKKYGEIVTSILAMEESDDPVDEKQLGEAQSQAAQIGSTLKEQMRACNAFTNTLSGEELNKCCQKIDDNTAALYRRDARYNKIFSNYQRFTELDQELLPALIAGDITPATRELVEHVLEVRGLTHRQISELLAQRPENVEKNSVLQEIDNTMGSQCATFLFAILPVPQQSLELCRLREMNQREASDAFERQATLFSLQRAHKGDYANVFEGYEQFTQHLCAKDCLSEATIASFAAINACVCEGIREKKINARDCISALEKVEKEHPSWDPVVLQKGLQYLNSDLTTTYAARRNFERCKEIEPANLTWTRALAFNCLHTLNYSQAEQLILEALAKEPDNEANKKLVVAILKDKYQTATLLLEWMQLIFSELSPDEKQTVSALQHFAASMYQALHIATHPTILQLWLPEFLSLPEKLHQELKTILTNESSLQFTKLNMLTLATRLIPAACQLSGHFISEKEHPTIATCTYYLGAASRIIQQAISAGLFVAEEYGLYSKFREGNLSLFNGVSASITTLLTPVNSAVGYLYPKLFRDESTQRVWQRTHPTMHSLIHTAGSSECGKAIMLSSLLWRSGGLAGRFVQKITNVPSETIGNIVSIAALAHFFIRIARAYSQERDRVSRF